MCAELHVIHCLISISFKHVMGQHSYVAQNDTFVASWWYFFALVLH